MICNEPGRMRMIEAPADGPKDYSGFIDQNTYCYRIRDDVMTLTGIILGYGWENREFKPEELSCYKKKGEKSMGKKREAPSKE
jgi:hypothetical protein